MLEGIFKRVEEGIFTLPVAHYEDFEKWPILHEQKGKFWKPRNLQFHKKYFALLSVGFDYQRSIKGFSDIEKWRKFVLYSVGWCDFWVLPDGKEVIEVKSISFNNCDEMTFSDLYNKTVTYFIKEICPGKSHDQINKVVDQYLRFT